ncbi:MAG: PaaI family thioesterase [Turneriella sp.]|nr:PaaI family thioesterase [Turneriella sp.]
MLFDEHQLNSAELEQLWQEMAAMKAKATVPLDIPPPSFKDMEGAFWRYRSRKAILVTFPVLPKQLNPIGVMQGGYMAAAFDNTLGPLSYVAAQKPAVTLDMSQTYLRAAHAGDILYCEAEVVTRGLRTIYMTASMYDARKKLIATAQTQILIL